MLSDQASAYRIEVLEIIVIVLIASKSCLPYSCIEHLLPTTTLGDQQKEMRIATTILSGCLVLLVTACELRAAEPLKVFILAGQSNMEGQAVADLNGKDYNFRQRHAQAVAEYVRQGGAAETFGERAGRMDRALTTCGCATRVSGDAHGAVVDRLRCVWWQAPFGPELQFGHVMGDHLKQQVLLIKTRGEAKVCIKTSARRARVDKSDPTIKR